MQSQPLTHSEILKQTQIDESGPGTILADFQTLLDFVGSGLKTGGKNYRIPIAALNDLDERMTHPLRPKLDRPQQLSFPHLNGLYLVLRASGLGVTSGQGTSGRLCVRPERLMEWNSLNPTERYMTLFQAMLSGSWGLIDATNRSDNNLWSTLRFDMQYAVQAMALALNNKKDQSAAEIFSGWEKQGFFALMELFGILEIVRTAPRQGENWRIASIQMTEFGEALLAPLFDSTHFELILDIIHQRFEREEQERVWIGDLFREYFPECQNTLGQSEEVFVDGVWQFKVTLWDAWRRIQIPADISVDELVDSILTAFRFGERDHLYEVQVRERSGQYMTIGHPEMDEVDYLTNEFAIGSLPLDPGMSMIFLFDFGASWKFDVKLEKVLPVNPKMTKPKVVEKEGKAPKQYDNDGW